LEGVKFKPKISKIMRSLAKTKTNKTIERNLLSWFTAATDEQIAAGLVWYDAANRESHRLANQYGVKPEQSATVLSALSPSVKWNRNVIDAENLIDAFTAGRSIDSFNVCTYGPNKRKAWKVLESDWRIEKEAPKTFSFVSNILGNTQLVTVDRWHARACLNCAGRPVKEVSSSIPISQYKRVESITQKLARRNGVTPSAFQAIIWVAIREA
jgi:hypothetical protein